MVKKKVSKKKANKSSNNFNRNLLIGAVIIILIFVIFVVAFNFAGEGSDEEGLAQMHMFDDNDNTNKNGNNYLITGIVLACDGGISVAPNLRMVNYDNTDKDSEMEYKVNFQFKF